MPAAVHCSRQSCNTSAVIAIIASTVNIWRPKSVLRMIGLGGGQLDTLIRNGDDRPPTLSCRASRRVVALLDRSSASGGRRIREALHHAGRNLRTDGPKHPWRIGGDDPRVAQPAVTARPIHALLAASRCEIRAPHQATVRGQQVEDPLLTIS